MKQSWLSNGDECHCQHQMPKIVLEMPDIDFLMPESEKQHVKWVVAAANGSVKPGAAGTCSCPALLNGT